MSSTEDLAPPPIKEHRFPCDNCGADFRVDPTNGRLIRDRCGNTSELMSDPWGGATLRELDFDAAIADRLPNIGLKRRGFSIAPAAGRRWSSIPPPMPTNARFVRHPW